MSDNEENGTKTKVEPTEERSLYVKYDDQVKDEITIILEDFEPDNVIHGEKKMFFIVTFEDSQERDSHKDKLDDKLKSKNCVVSRYVKSLRQKRMDESKKKIYVTGFDEEVTKEDLEKAFGEFGKVEEVILLKSLKEEKPYAFVKYEDEQSAVKAREDEVTVNDQKLTVEASRVKPFIGSPNREFPSKTSVMITNFDLKLKRDVLEKEVNDVQKFVKNRFSKDHAIFYFKKPAHADKVVKSLNGKQVEDNQIIVIHAPNISPVRGRGFRGRGFRGRGRRGRRWSRNGAEKKNAEKVDNVKDKTAEAE